MKKAYAGHYSGTVRTPVLVLNDDGDAFSWPVYKSIDYTAEKGALYRSLVENTLNQALCPNTGATYDLAVPVAIHDSSQKRFALFVPQSLRHRCFDFKQELISAFQQSSEMVPRYVSEFTIIFNASDFESLSDNTKGVNLDAERQQLAEVRERIDKERDQLNAVKRKNEDARLAFESEKSQFNIEKRTLEVEKLNLEQKLLEQSQGYDMEPPVESTQIVTDDQFLEVLDDEAGFELLGEASDFIEIEEDFDISPSRSGFPISSKGFVKDKKRSVQLINDDVVAIAESTPPVVSALSEGTSFFIQMHEIEDHSLISLMLAKLDSEGKIIHEISWPLDLNDPQHKAVIDKLRLNPRLRVGLYDTTGALSNGFKIQAPLASNLEWMLGRTKGSGAIPFSTLSETFISKNFEKLVGMKHGFSFDSFETIESPAAAKLAAGIVGYWSTDDMLAHLIGNRSFPLHQFRRIQERVIRGATEFGIYLNEVLRNRAVEIGISDSQRSLIQLMFANFAEVSVALRNNDLSPTEQWENWDSLLTTGESLGIPPDSDVVELAENSLKRAQDFHEIQSATHSSTGSQLIRDIFEDYRIEESADKKKEMRIPLSDNVEKVLPLLIRAVKTDGPLEKYAHLLVELEDKEQGTIGSLLKDRSKRLRDVAKEARKIRKATN